MLRNPTDDELDLEALFAEGEAVEKGVLLPMPSMPILRPVEPHEVSTGEEIDKGKVKQTATNEVTPVPPQLDALRIGDEIELPDGTRTKLQWVAPDRRRVGVGKRRGKNYTFFSMTEFVDLTGRQIAEDWKKKKEREAREEDMPPPTETPKLPAKVFVPKGFSLYPFQLENVEFLERKGRGLIADEMGLGKAQPLDAKVLTPSGWTCMGDLHVGDQVVDPDTGGAATVTGVFPQGEKDCWRITMSDGCATECCDEHLWAVHTPHDKWHGRPSRILPLRDFKDNLHQETSRGDRRRRWFVPLTAPVAGEVTDLPLDPYLLGLLLGDGLMPSRSGNGWGTPGYSSEDQELVDAVAALLPEGVSLKKVGDSSCDYRISRDSRSGGNGLTETLAKFGLCGCRSPEKFVPPEYLRSDVKARIALLRGLMDTDGSVTGSAAEFSSSSPKLRDAVIELAYSLGGFCSVYERLEPTYTHGGEKRIGAPSWRVYMRMPVNPFSLGRKADAWRPTNMARGIESVDYVGRKLMRCIAVDSKRSLYITDGYIVTHNTISAIVAMRTPAVVVCPSLLKVNWAREITRWHPQSSVAIISGTKAEAGAEYFDPEEDARVRRLRAAGKRPRRAKPPSASQVSQIQQKADIIVINYDVLPGHADWIMRRNNRTLIADEAHYLKTMDIRWDKGARRHVLRKASQRAAAFYEMQREIDRLILLTGTPILNRVKELFPLLHMLDPATWNSGFQFCKRYCAGEYEWVVVRGGRGRKEQVFKCDGRSHSDELHERIKGVYMMRHTKEQELVDFPDKTRRTKLVSMPMRWQEQYRKAARDFMRWVAENGGPEAVAAAQMAQQLVQLGKLRGIAAQGKIEAALQFIVEFFESTQRPLVVFALHEAVFNGLEDGIEKINSQVRNAKASNKLPPISREIRVGRITGKVSGAKRQTTIDDFQQEGVIDVLLYSIPIATGTTLTRASDGLFIERMWRPADLSQAEDRLHRIGQKNHVFITYLDAEGTIDSKLGQLLVTKNEAFSAVIDGVELQTEEAAGLVFGEMFREMGLDISPSALRAIRAAMEEESSELMDNPRQDGMMADPYVRASVLGVPFEEYIGDRHLSPNVRTAAMFDEDNEYIDTFGAEYYDDDNLHPNTGDEHGASDSWYDPL